MGNGPLESVSLPAFDEGLVVPAAYTQPGAITKIELGNRPCESVPPGDVHWGLGVPDTYKQLGHSVGGQWRQLGNGPCESVSHSFVHWGLLHANDMVLYIGAWWCPIHAISAAQHGGATWGTDPLSLCPMLMCIGAW